MYTYEHAHKNNITALAHDLCHVLQPATKAPVFICVGDSHFVADSLGPLVGQLLINNNFPCYVYGNLQHNVVNSNFRATLNFVKRTHAGHPLVIIDSALGTVADIGRVKLTNRVRVGAFSNPNSAPISHTSLLGFVNTSGINSLLFLRSVKLQKMFAVANFIAKSVYLWSQLNRDKFKNYLNKS